MDSSKPVENHDDHDHDHHELLPTIELIVTNAAEKRKEILKAFNESYDLYEHMFDLVNNEGHFMKADPLRHPLIFYLGHTAAFYMNKLISSRFLRSQDRIDPDIEQLVAIGVDEMSWDSLTPSREWPSLDEMKSFRDKVRAIVINMIEKTLPLEDNTEINYAHPFWTIVMGIEHEKIHLETTSCLIRQLPLKMLNQEKFHASLFSTREVKSEKSLVEAQKIGNALIEIPTTEVKIGRVHTGFSTRSEDTAPYYGWDNEFGSHQAKVESFQVSEKLISNAEFYNFVVEEGYSKQEFWSKEGWSWVSGTQSKHPKFWVNRSETQSLDPANFVLRLTFNETDSLPWDFPVEINCFEASAYCRWLSNKIGKTIRLPTEDEHYALLQHIGYDYKKDQTNVGVVHSSPTPVDKYKVKGIYDPTGNVWQWTRTPMYPFKGFEVHPIYDDFTMPTFDDKHNLFKGGSWISSGNLRIPSSRYAFRRHFFQHAGFRLVEPSDQAYWSQKEVFQSEHDSKNVVNSSSAEENQSAVNPYETDPLVNMYCSFNFGDRINCLGQQFPQFPIVQAIICEQIIKKSPFWQQQQNGEIKLRGLDIGCAVGRTSFEMTRIFDYVLGLDYSARFIQVASMLQIHDAIPYKYTVEGEIQQYKQATLNNVESLDVEYNFLGQLFDCVKGHENINEIKKDETHVKFVQRDACNLPADLGQYHCAIAANLVDRLPDPEKFLRDVGKFILPGGFLILMSPYTWLADYTPKDKWLGGKYVAGERVFTLHTIEDVLSPWFEPFPITCEGSGYDDPIYGFLPKGQTKNGITIPFCLRETRRRFQFTYSEMSVWRRRTD